AKCLLLIRQSPVFLLKLIIPDIPTSHRTCPAFLVLPFDEQSTIFSLADIQLTTALQAHVLEVFVSVELPDIKANVFAQATPAILLFEDFLDLGYFFESLRCV